MDFISCYSHFGLRLPSGSWTFLDRWCTSSRTVGQRAALPAFPLRSAMVAARLGAACGLSLAEVRWPKKQHTLHCPRSAIASGSRRDFGVQTESNPEKAVVEEKLVKKKQRKKEAKKEKSEQVE